MTRSVGPDADEARDRYNAIASRYDRQLGPLRRIQQRLRRDAVARLALASGATVLDVGCGTGASFAHLVDAVGPHGQVIGVDVSEGMLALATQRVRDAGWSNVHVLHAAAQQATWPAADGALLFFTHDVLRTPAALDGIVTAVRPGGRVVAGGARQPGLAMLAIALPVLFVMRRRYVTSGDGLRAPWDLLGARLDDMTSELRVAGLCYLAHGNAPASSGSAVA